MRKIFFPKFPTSNCPYSRICHVERSHIYKCVQLDENYQNILVTHLDHFWNSTLHKFSGSKYLKAVLKCTKSSHNKTLSKNIRTEIKVERCERVSKKVSDCLEAFTCEFNYNGNFKVCWLYNWPDQLFKNLLWENWRNKFELTIVIQIQFFFRNSLRIYFGSSSLFCFCYSTNKSGIDYFAHPNFLAWFVNQVMSMFSRKKIRKKFLWHSPWLKVITKCYIDDAIWGQSRIKLSNFDIKN